MKTTVLIPTWKRGDLLNKCLCALASQTRKADEVIVVHRDVDPKAGEIISLHQDSLPITSVLVTEPGVIHAENSGLLRATGDIICFLDDDAEAPPHWLETIYKHFESDPSLAGVGGPDYVVLDGDYRREFKTVGKLTWYGKPIGNHHQKITSIQEVDFLKGVNMSFKKSYLRNLDDLLHSEHSYGNGSQWELDLCLHVKKQGGRMIFDPSLDLKHYSNHSHIIVLPNIRNNAHNLTYVLLKHLSLSKRIAFLLYSLFIGNFQIIGLAKFIQMVLKDEKQAFAIYRSSAQGFFAGILTYLK